MALEERTVEIVGGPLDGLTRKVVGLRLIAPAEPIVRSWWDGEQFCHTFTEHVYSLRGDRYEYAGTRAK